MPSRLGERESGHWREREGSSVGERREEPGTNEEKGCPGSFIETAIFIDRDSICMGDITVNVWRAIKALCMPSICRVSNALRMRQCACRANAAFRMPSDRWKLILQN